MRHRPYRLVVKKVNLPAELVGRVELRLPSNPGNTGPAYGTWSKLIETLLTEWVREAEAEAHQSTIPKESPCE